MLRQDDNGNVVLIVVVDDEQRAKEIAAEYEARGHKQMYFVQAEASSTE